MFMEEEELESRLEDYCDNCGAYKVLQVVTIADVEKKGLEDLVGKLICKGCRENANTH